MLHAIQLISRMKNSFHLTTNTIFSFIDGAAWPLAKAYVALTLRPVLCTHIGFKYGALAVAHHYRCLEDLV